MTDDRIAGAAQLDQILDLRHLQLVPLLGRNERVEQQDARAQLPDQSNRSSADLRRADNSHRRVAEALHVRRLGCDAHQLHARQRFES